MMTWRDWEGSPLATELDHRRGERLGEAGSARLWAAINTIENSTDRAGHGQKSGDMCEAVKEAENANSAVILAGHR